MSQKKAVKEANDPVNHPSHYTYSKYEVIDVIEEWQLGYHDGNAIKYIARHKHKNNPVQDLKKACWYLQRLISIYEAGNVEEEYVTSEKIE
jgi:hypothetical protein